MTKSFTYQGETFTPSTRKCDFASWINNEWAKGQKKYEDFGGKYNYTEFYIMARTVGAQKCDFFINSQGNECLPTGYALMVK